MGHTVNKYVVLCFLAWVGYAHAGGLLVTNTFSSSFTDPLLIPDNNAAGVMDAIEVEMPLADNIIDISVSLNIASADVNDPAFNGDFYVYLQYAFGADQHLAVLLNRVGTLDLDNSFGYNDPGLNVTFNLNGSDIHYYRQHTPTYDASGRLLGEWSADGRLMTPPDTDTARSAGLDGFLGMNPNGTWSLFAADLSAGGQGLLNEWMMTLVATPEPGTGSLLLLGWFLLHILKRRASRMAGQ